MQFMRLLPCQRLFELDSKLPVKLIFATVVETAEAQKSKSTSPGSNRV